MAVLRRIGSAHKHPNRGLEPDQDFVDACLEQGKSKTVPADALTADRTPVEADAPTAEIRPTLAEDFAAEPQPIAPAVDETAVAEYTVVDAVLDEPTLVEPELVEPELIEPGLVEPELVEPEPVATEAVATETWIIGEETESVVIPKDIEPTEPYPGVQLASELAEPEPLATATDFAAPEPEVFEPVVDDTTTSAAAEAELAQLRERAAELEASLERSAEPKETVPEDTLDPESVTASIRSRLDVGVDRRLNYERELTAEAAAARREFEASRVEAEKAESALDTAEDGRRSFLEERIDSLRTELEEAEAELGAVIERQAPLWADFAKAMQRQSRAASRLTVIQQTIGENRRQAEQLRASLASDGNPGDRWLVDD